MCCVTVDGITTASSASENTDALVEMIVVEEDMPFLIVLFQCLAQSVGRLICSTWPDVGRLHRGRHWKDVVEQHEAESGTSHGRVG